MTLPRVSVRQLLALVAVCATVSALGTWLTNAVADARRAACRAQCNGHLCQTGLALHNYHDVYGVFPPAYVADAAGKPMHSWRVLILPFLEEQRVYDAYNFAEPWDGPNNRLLLNRAPWTYSCPNASGSRYTGPYTNYVALVGPGSVFPGAGTTRIADIRDGTADTLLIVETADAKIPWTAPVDLDATRITPTVNGPTHPGISSLDGSGAYVLFADATRRWVRPDIPPSVLKAWMTINGGEPVTKD